MKHLLTLIAAAAMTALHAQHQPDEDQADPHHHRHPVRVALLLGHGMVPEVPGDGVFFVPSWGPRRGLPPDRQLVTRLAQRRRN